MTREAMAKVTDAADPAESARLELQQAMEKDRRAAVEGQREIAEKRAAAAELIVHEANNARLKALLDAARDQAAAKDIQSAKQRFAEAKDDWEAALETRDRLEKDERRTASAAALGAGGWTSRLDDSAGGTTAMASGRQVAARLGVVVVVLAASAALYFWSLAPSEPEVGSVSTASPPEAASVSGNAQAGNVSLAPTAAVKPDASATPVPGGTPAASPAPVVLTTAAVPAPSVAVAAPAETVVPVAAPVVPTAKEAVPAPSSSASAVAKPVTANPVVAKPVAANTVVAKPVPMAIPAPPPLTEAHPVKVFSGPVPTPGRNPFRPETATPPVPVFPKTGPILLLRPEVE